jgi:hypothetical protein
MNCPKCGIPGAYVFKCDHCGEVRCSSGTQTSKANGCGSNKGPFGKSGQGAVNNQPCKACGKGKYKPL